MSNQTQQNQNALQLKKVMQAIPKEINEEAPTKDPLGDLISQISTRKVPVNSLTRLWALGSMQAKIAVGYLAYAMRSIFSNKNEQERILNETHLAAALKLLGTMGYLRGAVMKIGQLLGNLPHIVPEEVAETMERLQFEAPPMHYSLIREVFLDEFGAEPSELFATFDKKAFAAASLGQVHRATLKSGEEVAVKIQYPNMAATIRSDMANLRKTLMPMKLKQEGRYIFDHLDDAEIMLHHETDYTREAAFMAQVKELFGPEDLVVVPKVWEDYSNQRILTTDYLKGKHLRDYLPTNPDQEHRDHFGTLISRAVFRIYGAAKTIYADPHPGNFLFLDDDRLGLIDFGCYRTLSEEEWEVQIGAEKALMEGDAKGLDKAIAASCLFASVEEMEPERLDYLRRLSFWQAEPMQTQGPFAFGDKDFFQRGIDIYSESVKRGYNRHNSLYNWWARLISGHRTLLYRLNSNVDYRHIYIDEKTY
ncbi:MAG: AarF/ABC1/UbiB kinase family protein [Thermodesulfobacteriota bacterium]